MVRVTYIWFHEFFKCIFKYISLGRIPLWFAAAENNLKVVTYLITQEHDAYKLLEDRRVSKKKTFQIILVLFFRENENTVSEIKFC